MTWTPEEYAKIAALQAGIDKLVAAIPFQPPGFEVGHEWTISEISPKDPSLPQTGHATAHFQFRAGAEFALRVNPPDTKGYAYHWVARLGTAAVEGNGAVFSFGFDGYGVDWAKDEERFVEITVSAVLNGGVATILRRRAYLQPRALAPSDPEPIRPDAAASKAKADRAQRDVTFAEYCEMLAVDASSLPGDVLKELRRAWGGGAGMGSLYSDEELAARKAAFLAGPEPARGTAPYLDFTNPDWRRQSDQINSRLLRPYWDDTPGAWDTIRDCGEPGSGKACIQHGYFYPGGKRG